MVLLTLFAAIVLWLSGLGMWLHGEVYEKPRLRVAGGLTTHFTIVLGLFVSYALGGFFGAANQSIALTEAGDALLAAAVDALDAGDAERVHTMLRDLSERTVVTYEGWSVVETLTAWTADLKQPEGSSPAAK